MNIDDIGKDGIKGVYIKNGKLNYTRDFYHQFLTEIITQEYKHKRLWGLLGTKTVKMKQIRHLSEDEVLAVITPIKKYLQSLLITKPKRKC